MPRAWQRSGEASRLQKRQLGTCSNILSSSMHRPPWRHLREISRYKGLILSVFVCVIAAIWHRGPKAAASPNVKPSQAWLLRIARAGATPSPLAASVAPRTYFNRLHAIAQAMITSVSVCCFSSCALMRFADPCSRSMDDGHGNRYHPETPLPPICCPTAPNTNHMRCSASSHGMAQTRPSIHSLDSLHMTQSFKDHRAFALDSFIEASRLSKVCPVP